MSRLSTVSTVSTLAIPLVALLIAAPATAQAQAPAPAWLPLLAPALEAVVDAPKPEHQARFTPMALIDDAPAGLDGAAGSVHGKALRVINREQARDEQRAYFVRVSKVAIDGDAATLVWARPSTGHSGTLKLVKDGDAWKVADKTRLHSSSGARIALGELFDGVACRDGTEMAARWATMAGFMEALRATGKMPGPGFSPPPVCPGPEFPDVAAYRQSQLLLKK